MNRILPNHFFRVGVLAVLLLITPMTVTAQSNDDAYRSYLLGLIELLQQQIILLQAQSETGASGRLQAGTADFESFIFSDEHSITDRYLISEPRDVLQIDNTTHLRYFQRFFDLVPDEYDSYFIDLVVYEKDGSEFEGFVETVPPYRPDTWRLGLNEAMFEFGTDSRQSAELFIHEFSHVVSYEKIVGRPEPSNTTCHEYFSELGCPPANSYLMDFIDEFWTEDDLDTLVATDGGESIWTEREAKTNFVSEYASSDPAEDFAESFTYFVLADRPTGDSVPEQKIEYFYQYEKLQSIRDTIREEL